MQRASEFFSIQIFQHGHVEHGFIQELLELGVLIPQDLQATGIGDVHAAEPGLPLEERGAADAMTAADLRGCHPLFLLPQDRDDLLLGKTTLIHRPTSPLEAVGLYSFLDQFAGLTPPPPSMHRSEAYKFWSLASND